MLAIRGAWDNSSVARTGNPKQRVASNQSHVRDFHKTVAVASRSHSQLIPECFLACQLVPTAKVLQSLRTSGVRAPTCPLRGPVPPPDELFKDRSVTTIANERSTCAAQLALNRHGARLSKLRINRRKGKPAWQPQHSYTRTKKFRKTCSLN